MRCKTLADGISRYCPDVIATSSEPKAAETTQIIAGLLGKTFTTVEDLHEHGRSNVGWLDKEHFEEAVAKFFEQPQALVFGNETADQTHERFAKAVMRIIEKHPNRNIAIIAHGTVIALFVARALGLQPIRFWKQLGLPSFVVLSLPEMDRVIEIRNVETETQ